MGTTRLPKRLSEELVARAKAGVFDDRLESFLLPDLNQTAADDGAPSKIRPHRAMGKALTAAEANGGARRSARVK